MTMALQNVPNSPQIAAFERKINSQNGVKQMILRLAVFIHCTAKYIRWTAIINQIATSNRKILCKDTYND